MVASGLIHHWSKRSIRTIDFLSNATFFSSMDRSDSGFVNVPSGQSRPGSGSSRPGSAQHHLPRSISGPSKSKGPLGVPLVSSGDAGCPSDAAELSSGVEGAHQAEDRCGAPKGPLRDFVERVNARIQQRSQQSTKKAPLRERPAGFQRRGQSSSRVGQPDGTPVSKDHRPSSRLISPYTQSRTSTPLSVMTIDLVPPPPLFDDDASTGKRESIPPQRRGLRPLSSAHSVPNAAARATTPYEWIDAKRSMLEETAVAISPVLSLKHSAAQRTLADSAIRWRGVRAASALARAFEVARSTEEILQDGRIRLRQKLL